MKSIGFQRKKSLIRVAEEKQIKKRLNWDRLVYILLLAAFMIFITNYVYKKWMYVTAYGHVITENTRIRLTEDSRILQLKKHEGDSVKAGDTLFSYAFNSEKPSNLKGDSITEAWHTKEIYELHKSMRLNTIRIAENEQRLVTMQAEADHLTNAVILGAVSRSNLEQLQHERSRIISENARLKSENDELYRLANHLPAHKTTETTYGSDEILSNERYFRSPISGFITHLFIHQSETALKSEDILAINTYSQPYIKVFFDEKDLPQLQAGSRFNIKFPDGSTGTGILKRYYNATYALPDEFQKKYENAARCIAGDIYPENQEEEKKWKIFYKMKVDISKFKY